MGEGGEEGCVAQGAVVTPPGQAVLHSAELDASQRRLPAWLAASHFGPAASRPGGPETQLVFPADLDECADAGACGEAQCQNLPGSYSCLCDEGYAFSSQEKSCRGARPDTTRDTHTHACAGHCSPGSTACLSTRVGSAYLHTCDLARASCAPGPLPQRHRETDQAGPLCFWATGFSPALGAA